MISGHDPGFHPLSAAMLAAFDTVAVPWDQLNLNQALHQAIAGHEDAYYYHRALMGHFVHDIHFTIRMPQYAARDMVIDLYEGREESIYAKTFRLSCERCWDYLDVQKKNAQTPSNWPAHTGEQERSEFYAYCMRSQSICAHYRENIACTGSDGFLSVYDAACEADDYLGKGRKLLLDKNPRLRAGLRDGLHLKK